MAYWRSRGLRGEAFEELINRTNDRYRQFGLGLVQKIPTSIKPVELDPDNGNIKKAYFEKKSTVDYIGVIQGVPICFDAKGTAANSLPLKNIHNHQMTFMDDFEKQSGVSFFLVHFSRYNEIYFVPYQYVNGYLKNSQMGGRKSIPYQAICSETFQIRDKQGFYVHYLEGLQAFLDKENVK